MLEMQIPCLQYKCSVLEENEDVEEWTTGKSFAYWEACDRALKRAAPGLPLSEEQSIVISLARPSSN